MKKVFSLSKLFVIAFMALLFAVVPVKAFAASGDSVSNPIDISDGAPVSNALTDDVRKQYYSYTASDDGIVRFCINPIEASTSDREWQIQPYDGELNKASLYWYGTSFQTMYFTVSKGTRIVIEVSNYSGTIDKTYQLFPDFLAADVEKEPNNSTVTATKLTKDKTILGCINDNYKDVDFYEIDADKSGSYNVTVKRHEFNSTDTPEWTVKFYDDEANEVASLNTIYDNKSNIEGLSCVLKKGQKMYIGVTPYNSAAKKQLYEVTMTFKAYSRVESEPNDSIATADRIYANKGVFGSLVGQNKDYFKLKATKTGTYRVKLTLAHDVNYLYNFKVLDKNGNTVVSSDSIRRSGSIKFSAVKGKTYYICVSHDSTFWGTSNGVLYKLLVK